MEGSMSFTNNKYYSYKGHVAKAALYWELPNYLIGSSPFLWSQFEPCTIF